MKVKIKATGFGATALKDGTILHFDIDEKKAAKPDKRKLEAEVDIADAQRIKELGWGDFASKADAAAADVEDRAELGDEVQKLEEAPEPEAGKPSQSAPPADRDDPEAQVKRNAAARPKRPSEVKKEAEKAKAKAKAKVAANPASPPAATVPQQGTEDAAGDNDGEGPDRDDPEAGPQA